MDLFAPQRPTALIVSEISSAFLGPDIGFAQRYHRI